MEEEERAKKVTDRNWVKAGHSLDGGRWFVFSPYQQD